MEDRPMFYGATPEIFARAKELRLNLTSYEKLLWEKLNKNQLLGYRFKQQHPIANFIVDFYCHKAKLVIELDGDYHYMKNQKAFDGDRTLYLEELGLTVLRFRNESVLNHIEEVVTRIKRHLTRTSAHPLTP